MPLRALFAEACQEIREIERRLDLVEHELGALARQLPAVERLMQIPGIGLIIATALVGFVGDLRRFPSARHFASYLGLTHASIRAACAKGSAASPNAGIPTCACS